ncbi:hypothetical protein ACVWZK_008305 [Bradyrhizobium sp. GM0.4]
MENRLSGSPADGMTGGGANTQFAASPIVSPAYRPSGVRTGKNGFFAEGSVNDRQRVGRGEDAVARIAGTLVQDFILDQLLYRLRGCRHRNAEKRGQTLDGQHRIVRQNIECSQAR